MSRTRNGPRGPKARYSVLEHRTLAGDLRTAHTALTGRLKDVQDAFPTAAHWAEGYPLKVRLRMAVQKIEEAVTEAEALMFNDHPDDPAAHGGVYRL